MKTLQGIVLSVRDGKTARVSVASQWQHPVYLKSVKRSKNYACHLEGLTVATGDYVTIQECRPVSKTKRFKVVSKVEKK